MFRIENLRKIFELLDETQKTHPEFSPEEKLLLYRTAFYKESFEETRKAILQAAALNPGEKRRKELLEQYANDLPELPHEDAAQLEQYIFQLQQMCYEQDKAMEILENILKLNGINQEHNPKITELEEAGIVKSRRKKEETRIVKGKREKEEAGSERSRNKEENGRPR